MNIPFHYDYVGSFLRPDYLKKREKIIKAEKSVKKN